MSGRTSKVLSIAAACGFLFTGSAGAQTDLSEEEVRTFFDAMQTNITEMVEEGDFDRLVEWSDGTFADEATFAVTMHLYVDDVRKGMTSLTLDRDDITRMTRLASGMFAATQGAQDTLEDYSLEIDVTEMTSLGAEAAVATVQYVERVTFSVPQDQGDGASFEAEATAECRHLLQRDGDTLLLGFSTCDGEMRL